jgi:hypothetical protein
MSIPRRLTFVLLFALWGMGPAFAQPSWMSFNVNQTGGSCCVFQTPLGPADPTDGVQLLRFGQKGNVTNISLPLGAFASTLDIQALNGQINALNGQINQVFQQLQQSIVHVDRGVAAAVAMANISMPSAPGRTAWAMNASTFQGEFGTGFSLAHRLSTSMPLAVTASYGNGGGSAHVGRVGLMGEF